VLTILGGGYIAAELAHFFGTLGTQVNIVQRGRYLLANEDEEVAAIFTHLASEKYNVFLGYEPILVAKDGGSFNVTLQSMENRDETRILASDQLLVAVGRTPNSDTLDLEKTGVKTDPKGYILADNYLETTTKGIFTLGDALGRYPFKHVANHEAAVAYKNIMDPENKVEVDYTAMPHAIFTSPQIAGVGKTEQQLKAENAGYFVGRWNYAETAMGETIQDATGFVKFLIDRSTLKILGCHIMGTEASTLIHEVLVAMKSGDGTINSISQVVHVHPALPEVVIRAAEYIIDPTHHHEHANP
jgi:dihydrolipoamide dehydrogenase